MLEELAQSMDWKGPFNHMGRMVRKASPNEIFWREWRKDKTFMKDIGFQVSKLDGEFIVYYTGKEWPTDEIELPDPGPVPVLDIHPACARKLRDYQVQGAGRLLYGLAKEGCALDASETGLGKTYMSLAAMKSNGQRHVLVVCTKKAKHSWKRVAKLFGVYVETVTWQKLVRGNSEYTSLIDCRDHVQFHWHLNRKVGIIFDEAHYGKSYKSKMKWLIMCARFQGYKMLLLSATLAESPMDMQAAGYALGLFNHPADFWKWAESLGCYEGEYDWRFSGNNQMMKVLHHQIFKAGKGNRIRKADVPGFPTLQIVSEPVESTKAASIQVAYREMEQELAAIKAKATAGEMSPAQKRAQAMVAQLRARQKIEMLKVPLLVEWSKELIREGFSVPVFFSFTESLEAYAKKMGCPIINGNTKEREGVEIMDAFQADRLANLALNAMAGGESINLHDMTGMRPRYTLFNPLWAARAVLQVIGRTHRDGGRSHVVARFVYVAGTVEEEMALAVERKADSIYTLNDGDLTHGLKLAI